MFLNITVHIVAILLCSIAVMSSTRNKVLTSLFFSFLAAFFLGFLLAAGEFRAHENGTFHFAIQVIAAAGNMVLFCYQLILVRNALIAEEG